MIFLCCSTNAPYLPRIRPYLASVQAVANAEITPVLCCVDCQPSAEYLAGLDRWSTLVIPRRLLTFAPPLDHLQAGDFVRWLPGDEPADVVIFTDGDVIMQRPFTAAELEWLRTLPAGVVSVGYNAGPDDTLLTEAGRLAPHVQPSSVARHVDPTWPIYNTGVIVARRDTWQRLLAATLKEWPWAQATFGHYAAQQWAMCAAMARGSSGLSVEVLPYQVHTHGCYPLPAGSALLPQGVLTYDGTVVVFKHHL